jgi:TolB-like protein
MSIARSIAATLLLALAVATAGCTALTAESLVGAKDEIAKLTPKDVKTHAVRSIKTVEISRIAIMPVADDAAQGGEPIAPGGADAVTAELYSQAALAGGWQVIPNDDVSQAMQQLPPTTPANLDQNALALGRLVSADGVLYGTLERYKERVSFSLKFVDMKSKQVVWTASFAKSQKALSQNLFDLANFVQRQGRWVRAHEIAMEGVQQAVADLHDNLDLSKNVKRFETGTYGQLKSGQQRYNRTLGPAGIY